MTHNLHQGFKLKSIALIIAISPLSASAESLLTIYQQAVKSDPVVQSAQASLNANLELLNQADAALLPRISASANLTRFHTDSADFTNKGATLSLSQPLFDATAWFQVKQANSTTDSAKLLFEAEQQSLIQRVVSAYIQVLVAQNNLASAKIQEDAIAQRLEKAETELSTGTSQITSVLEAQASLDSARVTTIEAEGNLANSLSSLSRLTGTPVNQVSKLRDNYPIQLPKPIQAQPWIDKALKENKAVAIAELASESARLNVKSVRANRYPTVNLNASYDLDQGSASNQDRSDTASIGLTFSVPLYQGGALSSQSREAAYNHTAAKFDYDDARHAAKLGVTSLLRDLKTSKNAIMARQLSIVSNQRALLATEEGVIQGNRDLSDVLSAEQQLYAAQRDYENARLNHINNLVAFKQQIGSLSPKDIADLNAWFSESP